MTVVSKIKWNITNECNPLYIVRNEVAFAVGSVKFLNYSTDSNAVFSNRYSVSRGRFRNFKDYCAKTGVVASTFSL